MTDHALPMLFAQDALLPTGWARNVLLRWNAQGQLQQVQTDIDLQALGADVLARTHKAAGPVIPGMPNLHSHAFQRGFGGLTEFRGAGAGQFLELAQSDVRLCQPADAAGIGSDCYLAVSGDAGGRLHLGL